MDSDTRTNLVAAAAIMTGPVEAHEARQDGLENPKDHRSWSTQLHENAVALAFHASAGSQLGRVLDASDSDRFKAFPGTVVSVDKEASSTRGLVTLATRPSKHHPDGREQARTERTDSSVGLSMARRLRALVGHRVLVWVEVEEYDGGKARIVRHVEDIGVDQAYSNGASTA